MNTVRMLWMSVGILILFLVVTRMSLTAHHEPPRPDSAAAPRSPAVTATPSAPAEPPASVDRFSPYTAKTIAQVTVFQDRDVAENAANRTAVSALDPAQVQGLVSSARAAGAAWTLESGSSVRVLEREVITNNVGTEDAWARIQSPDGKTGWVLEGELLKTP